MSQPPAVIVYVKPACTLCGPVFETLERVKRDVDFSLEKVDISGDPALMAKYGNEVPVVTINGRKAFKGRVQEQQFKKKLKRARSQPIHEGDESDGEEIEALEALDAEPYVPPKPIAAMLVMITVGLFAWFLTTGFINAQHGRGKLAGELLRVEPRNAQPIQFTLESLSGKKISLDEFRGKVVFLNFWATWCPPCIEEMPSMARLYERMKNDPRFVMLAVSTDDGWDPVRTFFADKGVPGYTVLLDKSGAIAKQYGTTMFPETYIVVDGKITGFIEGPRNWDDWFVDEYLANVQ
jgi:thiol-disulfide isomerase/thioredoxin/glutaredoxin